MSKFNLNSLKVIGFDLDDTLHYYKKASKEASNKVLKLVAKDLETSIENLQNQYYDILAKMQSNHFIEDKSSTEYRKRRFQTLLELYHISDEAYIFKLIKFYDNFLARELKLKDGAWEILSFLNEKNKMITVITEGPFDAQKLTLERLGIAPFIDYLFTSSKYHTSKTDHLFKIVLEELHCDPEEMLYVGDNIERDYYAAAKLGIHVILINEQHDKDFEVNTSNSHCS